MTRDLPIVKTVNCPMMFQARSLQACDKCEYKGARSKHLQTCKWDRLEWQKHTI